MTVIWCMVPEIWSVADRIFCHFGPFLPFYLSNNPKNQNFEKMKKTPGYITILHICTINDNHMMYSSWDVECDRHNFLSFWTIYLHFYPSKNQKNQNFEKMKKKQKPGDIFLHRCTINDNHLMYGSWDIECDGQNFFVILDHLLPFYTSDNPKNQKFWKNEKNTWRYYHFIHVYHKWESYDIWFLRYVVWQTEFFVILGCFSPFYLPNNPKTNILKKWKKTHTWRYHHLTKVYQKS